MEKWMRECFDIESPEVKTGLNKSQLKYMWAVYADKGGITRCHFPIVNADGSLHYCGAGNDEAKIEVNHILARGFAKDSMGMNSKQIDNPLNLICLCSYHHVGDGYCGEPTREQPNGEITPVYHPDNIWARRNYRGTTKPTSYDRLMEHRREQTKRGVNYCNEYWTAWMLCIAEEMYWRYYNETRIAFPLRKNQCNS